MTETHRERYDSLVEQLTHRAAEVDDGVVQSAKQAVFEARGSIFPDSEEEAMASAFGYCLLSENGPSHHWTHDEYGVRDGDEPLAVAEAMAETALVNDVADNL